MCSKYALLVELIKQLERGFEQLLPGQKVDLYSGYDIVTESQALKSIRNENCKEVF